MRVIYLFIGIALGLAASGCGQKTASTAASPTAASQSEVPFDRQGFNGRFPVESPADPQAALYAAFDAGLHGAGQSDRSFLRRVLAKAGIDERSQVLVFSKTSMQNDAITHDRPRAIYFSDDAYIGAVQGGMLEFAQADAKQGTVFHALDFRSHPSAPPQWQSPPRCMDCHAGPMVGDRAGLVVRSVFTDAGGQPITSAGTFVVGHATPLADRWGGWFVTGSHGAARHMGNGVAVRQPDGGAKLDRDANANLKTLSGTLDTELYLRPTSDIVALMVLEHQVTMHNAYTQGSLLVREQVARFRAVEAELGRPDAELSPSIREMVRRQADKIVGLALFQNEAPLPAGGIEGDSGFQAAFRRNRVAADHHSLKDFQLLTRLFKYRCSYTVYSRAFRQMDPLLKAEVWRRLRGALAGDNSLGAHLPAVERAQIAGILRATHPEWRQ